MADLHAKGGSFFQGCHLDRNGKKKLKVLIVK